MKRTILMLLNDQRTFTDLKGCLVVSVPADWDTEQITEAIREGDDAVIVLRAFTTEDEEFETLLQGASMSDREPTSLNAVANGLFAHGNDLYRAVIEHAAEMDDVATDDAAELAAAIESTYRGVVTQVLQQCGWKPTPKAEEG